ncbi:hypothetical protein [Paraburkholderia sp. J94]|uniref:hypothetical protein n=1 Tax=Paraburkholderia sp. J94 TaxID=2805441 RepID=UPI002AB02A35|nr:hypothetical protein [Paraburkholderia sp. J94]
MNLQDQIGALEVGVDQLIQAVRTAPALHIVDTPAAAAPATALAPDDAPAFEAPPKLEVPPSPFEDAESVAAPAQPCAPAQAVAAPQAELQSAADEAAEVVETVESAADQPANAEAAANAAGPLLEVGRPSQNEITMTIGGQTVSLHPMQVGQLIEELANARASMQPEPPPGIPPGWRFASTKNPTMAVQKQSNGDRLLVLRHNGHGWVPFTFSPDMVVQMYMMLTQR